MTQIVIPIFLPSSLGNIPFILGRRRSNSVNHLLSAGARRGWLAWILSPWCYQPGSTGELSVPVTHPSLPLKNELQESRGWVKRLLGQSWPRRPCWPSRPRVTPSCGSAWAWKRKTEGERSCPSPTIRGSITQSRYHRWTSRSFCSFYTSKPLLFPSAAHSEYRFEFAPSRRGHLPCNLRGYSYSSTELIKKKNNKPETRVAGGPGSSVQLSDITVIPCLPHRSSRSPRAGLARVRMELCLQLLVGGGWLEAEFPVTARCRRRPRWNSRPLW